VLLRTLPTGSLALAAALALTARGAAQTPTVTPTPVEYCPPIEGPPTPPALIYEGQTITTRWRRGAENPQDTYRVRFTVNGRAPDGLPLGFASIWGTFQDKGEDQTEFSASVRVESLPARYYPGGADQIIRTRRLQADTFVSCTEPNSHYQLEPPYLVSPTPSPIVFEDDPAPRAEATGGTFIFFRDTGEAIVARLRIVNRGTAPLIVYDVRTVFVPEGVTFEKKYPFYPGTTIQPNQNFYVDFRMSIDDFEDVGFSKVPYSIYVLVTSNDPRRPGSTTAIGNSFEAVATFTLIDECLTVEDCFPGVVTPTAWPSPTVSPTAQLWTPAPTRTPSPTPSPTPSLAPTLSPTPTELPSGTATPSATVTSASATPTASATVIPSASETNTPIPSPTVTPLPSPSPSATVSPTLSETPSSTPSVSPSPSPIWGGDGVIDAADGLANPELFVPFILARE
jgi:hypothetical protein